MTSLSVIFLSFLILKVASSRSNDFESGIPSHGKCQPIKVALCKDIQYNKTIMPNILGHSSQEEAEIDINEFKSLIKTGCSPYLKFFLCSVFVPVCTVMESALPPCKSLCLQAKNNCDLVMKKNGYEWPPILDCNSFPEGDLCVGQNQSERQARRRKTLRKPLTCPAFMQLNKVHEYSLTVGDQVIENCGMPCNSEGDLFGASESSHKVFKLVICIFAGICFFSSFFTFLTFLIDTKRFQYPERPIIFMSACYCVISASYIVGFIINDKASCSEFETQYQIEDRMIVSIVTQGTKKEGCTILFVMLYFCGLASCLWWVVLTITWFLSAGLKWGQEAVESRSQYFHLVAWAIPGIMTIVLLGMGHVDGDLLTGACYTGLTNATVAKAFVVGPLILLLFIGLVFLISGFVSLCRVRRAMKHDGSRVDKLEKLMMRIGVFALLYVVPVGVVVACVFYEHSMMPSWTRGWYHRMCSNFLVGFHQLPGPFQQWECGDYMNGFSAFAQSKPDITIFTIKHLMTLVVGVACGFWVVSGKTAHSWSRLFSRNNQNNNQQLKPTLL